MTPNVIVASTCPQSTNSIVFDQNWRTCPLGTPYTDLNQHQSAISVDCQGYDSGITYHPVERWFPVDMVHKHLNQAIQLARQITMLGDYLNHTLQKSQHSRQYHHRTHSYLL
jgi:hypothetical protein